jgi:Ca2+-binding RTX toxin-like protein
MHTHLPLAGALLAGLALAGSAQAAAQPPGVDVDVRHHTLIVQGTPAGDAISLRHAGPKLEVDLGRDGSAEFRIDRWRFHRVVILTGDGDDIVDGGPDDDVALLGAGDDHFVWEPGDGSDALDGGEGSDEQLVHGTDAGDRFELEASRELAHFEVNRDTLRSAGVERLATVARGGADRFAAGDVTGTVVNDIDTDVGTDGSTDRVVVHGGDESDFGSVFGGGQFGTFVGGMSALVQLHGAEPRDELTVRGRGGDDRLSAGGFPATGMQVTLDGDAGDDALEGGNGHDTLRGDAGTDHADPNGGDDVALLGAGLDILRWDPGDGSDVVEGQEGHDVLLFIGSADAEAFAATAEGRRVRFTRDLGSIVMTLGGMEKIDTLAQGGSDALAVGDLAGTSMEHVEVNLGGSLGGPASDGAADRVTVAGTAAADAIVASGAGTTADVTGLPATVRITRADAATDTLAIDGGEGADTLDASGLPSGTIGLEFVD